VQGELLDTPAIQRLLWIPGIGRIVAFTLALEVDDIQRFPTVRHFWSYCRLVPGAADSGGRHRHRASKAGNRYLKLAFSHATVRAIQYFPEIRQWYQRWKRKKPIRIARALVAKELAKSVYVVLHDQVDCNQEFKGTPLTRQNKAQWPRRASPLPNWTRQRAPARDWEARRSCRGEDLGRGRVTALRSPHREPSRAPNGV